VQEKFHENLPTSTGKRFSRILHEEFDITVARYGQ